MVSRCARPPLRLAIRPLSTPAARAERPLPGAHTYARAGSKRARPDQVEMSAAADMLEPWSQAKHRLGCESGKYDEPHHFTLPAAREGAAGQMQLAAMGFNPLSVAIGEQLFARGTIETTEIFNLLLSTQVRESPKLAEQGQAQLNLLMATGTSVAVEHGAYKSFEMVCRSKYILLSSWPINLQQYVKLCSDDKYRIYATGLMQQHSDFDMTQHPGMLPLGHGDGREVFARFGNDAETQRKAGKKTYTPPSSSLANKLMNITIEVCAKAVDLGAARVHDVFELDAAKLGESLALPQAVDPYGSDTSGIYVKYMRALILHHYLWHTNFIRAISSRCPLGVNESAIASYVSDVNPSTLVRANTMDACGDKDGDKYKGWHEALPQGGDKDGDKYKGWHEALTAALPQGGDKDGDKYKGWHEALPQGGDKDGDKYKGWQTAQALRIAQRQNITLSQAQSIVAQQPAHILSSHLSFVRAALHLPLDGAVSLRHFKMLGDVELDILDSHDVPPGRLLLHGRADTGHSSDERPWGGCA
ncbi:hypothetical protein T492DRAFT_892964 [Pavlovales sp. CCMP2436]|nr:hypothetical protein T492DRAFT_892964 [Pavlovales sp. CCMP2436]